MDLVLYLPVLVAIGMAIYAAFAYGRRKDEGPKSHDKTDRIPDE